MKRKKLLMLAKMWVNLKNFMMGKKKPDAHTTYYMILFILMFRIG